MDRYPHTPSGFSMSTLIDQDIAHIGRVMRPSLQGDFGGAILPATYWRKRLHELLARDHLTKPQLCAIDGLLLQLEHLDASELQPLPFMARPAAARPTKSSRAPSRPIATARSAPANILSTPAAAPPGRRMRAVASTRHRQNKDRRYVIMSAKIPSKDIL
jgi:hypothetical protein